MENKWDLSDIYESIDCIKFKNDLKIYSEKIDELNKWTKNNLNNLSDAKTKLETYILKKNKLSEYEKISIYLNLALSTDTSNEKISKIIDIVENTEAKITNHEVLFIQFLKSIDNIDDIIKNSQICKEHSFYLKGLKEKSNHTLSLAEEEIISKMKITGSSMWSKLWDKLSSNLTVCMEENGKEKQFPLSVIRNFAYSDNADLRKKAYECELKAYKKIETSAAFCLNGIKGEVITLSKVRNYSSPLNMTLSDSKTDKKMLDSMLSAIKEYMPSIRKYFTKKANILGHKNGLPFYDLFAPISQNDLKFSYEDAKNFVIKNFTEFNPKLGDFAKYAFDLKWIDPYPKKGKMGGAFCESIHSIKQSRILTNFTGSFNDVITLAHELGHAYHNTCLYDETPLNSDYPMPIAETASTLCETIIINSALKTADKDDRFIILENDISGITQVIIDIYSRFIFEDNVFKKRENGILSENELNNIMLSSQKEAYGNGLDENFMHKYMWICKPHYYDADFNYYNFPYAFGLLFAKGLYAKYTADKENFLPLYNKMLSETGKKNLYDIAKICGIDLYSLEFWRSSLKIIEDGINMFINL